MAKGLIKNNPLSIEELYSLSIKKLKYSKIEIGKAIYQMILKKVLVKGKKITKDSVLENITRNDIFNFILNNPGRHLREIRDHFNLTPHHADWHLNILEKFGFIRKNRIENKLVYFGRKIEPIYDKLIYALKNQDNLKVLKCILSEPNIQFKILVSKVQFKVRKVKRIISNLKDADLIYGTIDDGLIKYCVNRKNIDELRKFLKI